MAEQIECVGGPLDGNKMHHDCKNDKSFGYILATPQIVVTLWEHGKKVVEEERLHKNEHRYRYNPTTNTYEYEGVLR